MTNRFPIGTAIACCVCLLVTLGYLTEVKPGWEAFSQWGSPSPFEVWQGKWWAPITSAFVHSSWWHLGFNLAFLAPLSSLLEQKLGFKRWSLFFVSSAFASYGVQLGAMGVGGHGVSGIVFAIGGWVCAIRPKSNVPRFVKILTITLLAFWLLGLVTTLMGFNGRITKSGEVAHFFGLVFGYFTARAFFLNEWSGDRMIVICIFVFAITALFWAPWRFNWVSTKATIAYDAGEFDRSEKLLFRSLEMGEDSFWVWTLLAYVYATTDHQKYEHALMILRKIDENRAEAVEKDTRRERAGFSSRVN